MKTYFFKQICLLFALSLLLGLAACGAGTAPGPAAETTDPAKLSTEAPVSFDPVNFNNRSWWGGDFWIQGNTAVYMKDGFYNMEVHLVTDSGSKRLFRESDFKTEDGSSVCFDDMLPLGDTLYFVVSGTDAETLYAYDLAAETWTELYQAPYLYGWTVTDHWFIYQEHPTNNEEKRMPLHAVDLDTGTEALVCADVPAFGLVDGALRYLTLDEEYALYEYDPAAGESRLLGGFPRPEDGTEYRMFSFTAGETAAVRFNKPELTVLHLDSGETSVYSVPKQIHQHVAWGHAVWMVLYDEMQYQSTAISSSQNGVYRLDMTDGSFEKLPGTADNNTKIHVASDGTLYILQRTISSLGKATVTVYRWDEQTGERVELFDQ